MSSDQSLDTFLIISDFEFISYELSMRLSVLYWTLILEATRGQWREQQFMIGEEKGLCACEQIV